MNRNLVAAPSISQHTVAINPAVVVASTMMQVGNCIVYIAILSLQDGLHYNTPLEQGAVLI